MRPGREIDTDIAERVLGHRVKVKQKTLWEEAPKGERPLRQYSKDLSAAWEVAEKMNITLIPVETHSWFAMVGKEKRWNSPADFLTFLQEGTFAGSGAAVGDNPALTICLAALKAIDSQETAKKDIAAAPTEDPQPIH